MNNKALFTENAQDRAQKEIDCYGYCLQNGIENYLQGKFAKSAAYLDNASRSLRELERMKQEKETHDQAWFLLKQLEARQQQDELKNRLRASL